VTVTTPSVLRFFFTVDYACSLDAEIAQHDKSNQKMAPRSSNPRDYEGNIAILISAG